MFLCVLADACRYLVFVVCGSWRFCLWFEVGLSVCCWSLSVACCLLGAVFV